MSKKKAKTLPVADAPQPGQQQHPLVDHANRLIKAEQLIGKDVNWREAFFTHHKLAVDCVNQQAQELIRLQAGQVEGKVPEVAQNAKAEPTGALKGPAKKALPTAVARAAKVTPIKKAAAKKRA